MATTPPISAVVAELVARISAVPDVGQVHDHDPWHRDDVVEQLSSEINGIRTLRAWWVRGPTMSSSWESAGAYPGLWRDWVYTIEGCEGLAPAYDGDTREPGGDIVTLRDLGLAVSDAIDVDKDLGGTGFSVQPCEWVEDPEHVVFAGGIAVSYLKIRKLVRTFTGP